MLELSFIQDHKDKVLEGLDRRCYPAETAGIIDNILKINTERKTLQTFLDEKRSEINKLSGQIGLLFKSGKADEANTLKDEVGKVKDEIGGKETQLNEMEEQLTQLLYKIPNVPHPSVPKGQSEEDNVVHIPVAGPLPELGDDAKPHWELAKQYSLFDLELGVKITGAGFPLYRGKGAKLERALINYFLDEASKRGYEEIIPPLLVNEASGIGTGSLPDKEGQMYYIEKDDLYLIPTAEVPVTNMYRGDILDSAQLPIKLTGYTPCFRREAGSYGAHVRGLNRVHQFNKVEIVRFEKPESSYAALEEMLKHVSDLLNALELPFRVLRLCGGDLTFASALTYDFEVYSAAQKRWLEVSSVSNFETFQSNRMKVRYKDENKKKNLVHTLNGSALALARIMACILENNQTPEGIKIPEVLRPYTRFDIID